MGGERASQEVRRRQITEENKERQRFKRVKIKKEKDGKREKQRVRRREEKKEGVVVV